ncbi:MAG: hypothetical protein QF903_10115 [Planctomycetota bacterium]|nr:hypothetical protein [Planctomycetota bacterium]
MVRTLGVLALAAVLACRGEAPPVGSDWPAGRAETVGGAGITVAVVVAAADALAALKPSYTRPMLRRQALTHVLFTRAVARLGHADERAAARAAADAWRAGEQGALVGRERRGTWNELGLDLWLAVRDLQPDEWSPVCEGAGLFFAARVLERSGAPPAVREGFVLELVEFPWRDDREGLALAVFEQRLVIVDPAFGAVVPERWKIPMMEPE